MFRLTKLWVEPGNVKEQLQQSIDHGDLSEAKVTEAAINILTQVMKSPSYNQLPVGNSPDLSAHAKLARQAGAESMVLLRNEAAALISGFCFNSMQSRNVSTCW